VKKRLNLFWDPYPEVDFRTILAEELLDRLSLDADEFENTLYKDIGRSKLVSNVLEENSKLTLINEVVKPFKRAGGKLKDDLVCEARQFMRTGFDSLDRVLGGGIRRNTITQLIGEPQTGKTTLLHMAIKQVLQESNSNEQIVLYISPVHDEAVMKQRVVLWLMR
jgi:predicted ATP-dependent serine protease